MLVLAIFFGTACASIQLSPTMGPLEETVLEGEGSEKVILIDLLGMNLGIVKSCDKKDFMSLFRCLSN